MSKVILKLEFDDERMAHHFANWLCGAGEQDYWEWMKVREEEEEGKITAVDFQYSHPIDITYPQNDGRRYKNSKFLGDMTIRTTSGRLDEPEILKDEK